LKEGYRRALADGKPVLVRAGSRICPRCRQLAAEIEKPAVQQELTYWTLVYLDVAGQPLGAADEAAGLGIELLPALRILTARGRLVASHDGLLTGDELIAWLEKHRQNSLAAPDDVLLGSEKPDPVGVVRLVRQLGSRDPAVREAAVRRLQPYPDVTAAAVVKAFREGSLSVRLAALEVLREWQAPVEGMDPWRPETLTDERLAALEKWIEAAGAGQPARLEKLSEEQLAAARESLDRMLKVPPAEADAMGERLARLGPPLLPEVYAWLKQATTDQHRQRLLVLRYRLVSSDSLGLRWPGGLVRLAATDSKQRQAAAEELARLAGQNDQRLLLELFSDPDPLVREISLRGLQHLGGKEATAALVELLKDPEPNVRAAVLKQLAEDPGRELVPMVAEYLKTEKDPDLVVHAIRFLRAAGGRESLKSLVALLGHESWQVRAEAAEAIGTSSDLDSVRREYGPSGTQRDELKVDAYVALLKLLDDPDAFVVSRAVEGLSGADMAVAVEPLVSAAVKHPDLAAKIVEMLARGDQMRPKALPHLRKFCQHEDPLIRAAAVAGVCQAEPDAAEEELAAGLQDADSRVRTAAASAVFELMERQRMEIQVSSISHSFGDGYDIEVPAGVVSSAARVLAEWLKGRAGGPGASGVTPVPLKPEAEEQVEKRTAEPTPEPPSAQDQKTPPEGDQPDAEAESPWDRRLKEYYAGRGRPKWADQIIPHLEKMLAAAPGGGGYVQMPYPSTARYPAEERLAAALAMVTLGKAEPAVPVLIEAARSDPRLVVRAGSALPWLLSEQRVQTFDQLRKLAAGQDDLAALIYALVEVPDRGAAGLFWELLADEKLPLQTVTALEMGLRAAYLGQRFSSVSQTRPSDRKELVLAAKERVATGSKWQRLAALSLLASAAPEEAAPIADQLAHDAKADEALRRDAFHVALATKPQAEAVETAIAALSAGSDQERTVALAYLVGGRQALTSLRGGLHLILDGSISDLAPFRSGEAIALSPPAQLKAEHVRALLDSPDSKTAAYAGYLLALLGERQGLDKLLEYRRAAEEDRDQVDRLVYRAIAALDDAAHLPVLEEIYRGLDRSEVGQFYWTIRTMTGREVLRLRAKIREEVGMENLR
jgi:HEAT repeat protein